MENTINALKKYALRFFNILKWIVIGAVIGLLCGLLGTAFDLAVEFVSEIRAEYPYVIYAMPVIGLAIIGMYKMLKADGQNTNSVIAAVHNKDKVPITLFPAIFLGTVLTQLAGGSAGREGAALQMGGTVGSTVGRVFNLKNHELSIAIMAGMAGYFAAIFGTPLTASVFIITVVHIGVTMYEAFIPSLAASVVAYLTAVTLGVKPTVIHLEAPALDIGTAIRVFVLATAATIVSVVFYKLVHATEHVLAINIKNRFIRVFAGGCVLVVLTFLVGSQRYNGAGMGAVFQAIEQGQAGYFDWALKILFTAITLGCGFKGGEVVPSFFIGSTFGFVFAQLIGLDPKFGAALGMVSVFCAATNCLLGSLILAIEVFGGTGLLYFGIACAMSYIFSGDSSLYSTQKVSSIEELFTIKEK